MIIIVIMTAKNNNNGGRLDFSSLLHPTPGWWGCCSAQGTQNPPREAKDSLRGGNPGEIRPRLKRN